MNISVQSIIVLVFGYVANQGLHPAVSSAERAMEIVMGVLLLEIISMY